MAVTPRLELRQSQSLVMTPQLQQAIKLLQLSNVELVDFVEQELESNPLLERESAEDGNAEGGGAEGGEAATGEAENDRDTLDYADAETLPSGTDQPLDATFDPEDDAGPGADWQAGPLGGESGPAPREGFDGEGQSIDQRLGERIDLREHLIRQLQIECAEPTDRMIGLHLIDMLNEAGYLDGDLGALADLLACPLARVEATLSRLQTFEPTGIFARGLGECLALQLAERNRLDPAMTALLENLDLMARQDLEGLKARCGVDDEDLAEMLAEIRALDPKPAMSFDVAPAEPVVPDILMRARPDGAWQIELNSETLPRVLANHAYYARVLGKCRGKQDREYVTERFQQANWLVKALHQRATTILKVASEIVRQQDGFFRKGVQHMKPMTLRNVAEAIEMHESTVSRATSNKYMATPRGTYELKYFFGSAIAATDSGAAHSGEAVRDRIRRLVSAEDPRKVLSDDAIVDLLRADGVDIARRTVAKYRDVLKIPSSVQRRREKAASP